MLKRLGLAKFLIVVFALFSGGQVNAATSERPWKVGHERETTSGTYMKLIAVSQGWRIWREEWKGGSTCSAVKPAKSVPQPQPFSSSFFYGSYPAIVVSETKVLSVDRLNWSLVGRDINPTDQEIRLAGERFYTERPGLFAGAAEWNKLLDLDGVIIEAHVGSWKYPALAVDYAERTGVIDLTGLRNAVGQIRSCRNAK